MTQKRSLEELQTQLFLAERELAAWEKSKYGAANAAKAAKLVESLRAAIAAYGPSDPA